MAYDPHFEMKVEQVTNGLRTMLIAKNQAYGNSALDPVRIFSRAKPVESLLVRIDDKLSRLARGSEYPGDDTIDDLIGYLVLLKIAQRDEASEAETQASLLHRAAASASASLK